MPAAQAAVHVPRQHRVQRGVLQLRRRQRPSRLPVGHCHAAALGRAVAQHPLRQRAQAQAVVPERAADLHGEQVVVGAQGAWGVWVCGVM